MSLRNVLVFVLSGDFSAWNFLTQNEVAYGDALLSQLQLNPHLPIPQASVGLAVLGLRFSAVSLLELFPAVSQIPFRLARQLVWSFSDLSISVQEDVCKIKGRFRDTVSCFSN